MQWFISSFESEIFPTRSRASTTSPSTSNFDIIRTITILLEQLEQQNQSFNQVLHQRNQLKEKTLKYYNQNKRYKEY